MKAVLIGTAAYRENSQDLDLIMSREDLDGLIVRPNLEEHIGPLGYHYAFKPGPGQKPIEILVPGPGTAHELVYTMCSNSRIRSEPIQLGTESIYGLVPDHAVLLALKKAHLIHPKKWNHHMREYKILKNSLGITVFSPKAYGEEVSQIFKTHRAEVLAFAKPHPKLNVDKSYFFEDAEFKIFDHDTIHQAVALGSVPAYTLMQDGQVWCSRKKWNALNEEERKRCVIEEACVLALERSIIPAVYLNVPFRGDRWAYEFALFKVCTTITSGWFRDYAIEHYWEIKGRKPLYMDAFFEGLKTGLIKILKPEVVGIP